MGKTYRTQKQGEKDLIREFVRASGYSISRPQWVESPDAVLTLRKGTVMSRAAIEITDYYNDTDAGECSPRTPIFDFWDAVQTSVIRRISHRTNLADIQAFVTLRENRIPQQNGKKLAVVQQDARRLAQDVVAFVNVHEIPVLSPVKFTSNDFAGYPTLESLVTSMSVYRIGGGCRAHRCGWRCSNTSFGFIGTDVDRIKIAIDRKNTKAARYNWRSANEKWLLIAASGSSPSNRAGPPDQLVNWSDPQLQQVCGNSPFQRIFFWDYVLCWYKSLKPDEPAVSYASERRRR
jgi:hypothetical protein